MLSDLEPTPTGVAQAILLDVLLGLGIDKPLALTPRERARVVEEALAAGAIEPRLVRDLRDMGILPPTGGG